MTRKKGPRRALSGITQRPPWRPLGLGGLLETRRRGPYIEIRYTDSPESNAFLTPDEVEELHKRIRKSRG